MELVLPLRVYKDHTCVIRLGQQALYSLSHLTGSRTFDLV